MRKGEVCEYIVLVVTILSIAFFLDMYAITGQVTTEEPTQQETILPQKQPTQQEPTKEKIIKQKPEGITTEPVSWWKLDGDYQDVQGINEGIPVGNPTFVKGKKGQAVHFDGNSHINIPDHPSLNPLTVMSLSLWIKTTDEGTSKTLAVKTNGCDGNLKGHLLWLNANNNPGSGIPGFWAKNYPWVHACDTKTGKCKSVADGKWHHIAGVYDGTTTRIYIDGKLVNRGLRSGILNTPGNDLQLGGTDYCGLDFEGTLDDIQFYTIALTTKEIEKLAET